MALPRWHLIELEDSPQLPRRLRDMMTEYLRWVMDVLEPYDQTVPVIAELLQGTGSREVVDLASGSGGPWMRLLQPVTGALGERLRVTLTDLYPNDGAFQRAERESGGRIRGYYKPVNAAAVPPALTGVRTIFTGLHHLRPEQVRVLLRDSAAQRQPFAAFELTERSVLGMLAMVGNLVLVLVSAPLIRPFRLERLILTWLVPVLPVCIVWDGVVSVLRTYTRRELRAFATEASSRGYEWEAGCLPAGRTQIRISFLIGRPAV